LSVHCEVLPFPTCCAESLARRSATESSEAAADAPVRAPVDPRLHRRTFEHSSTLTTTVQPNTDARRQSRGLRKRATANPGETGTSVLLRRAAASPRGAKPPGYLG